MNILQSTYENVARKSTNMASLRSFKVLSDKFNVLKICTYAISFPKKDNDNNMHVTFTTAKQ
jgi:hypothetical protein